MKAKVNHVEGPYLVLLVDDVVSLKDIKAGEEVTVSLSPTSKSKKE